MKQDKKPFGIVFITNSVICPIIFMRSGLCGLLIGRNEIKTISLTNGEN
jgi:hypothetical protein